MSATDCPIVAPPSRLEEDLRLVGLFKPLNSHEALAAVVREWRPVLRGFDLVEWFLTPSPWLQAQRPIDLIDTEPHQVRRAAQADRFLITF